MQTYAPDHPAIRFAARHDYDGFARDELAERRAMRWPPFTRVALLGAIGRSRPAVEAAIGGWADVLRGDARFDVLGPAPYAVARVNDEWRYRAAVRTRAMEALRSAIRAEVVGRAVQAEGVRLVVTIDA